MTDDNRNEQDASEAPVPDADVSGAGADDSADIEAVGSEADEPVVVEDSLAADESKTELIADGTSLAEGEATEDAEVDWSEEWADDEPAGEASDAEAQSEEDAGSQPASDEASDEAAEEPNSDPVWADGESVEAADGALWSDSAESDTAPVIPVGQDPWVRVLLVTAMSLVVVLLVTTGAFYLYMRMLNHAPRTVAEQAVTSAETAVKETPKNVRAWITLAYAYASAGDYDAALSAAAKGEKVQDGEALAVVRGDVLRLAKRHKDAIVAYDRAEKRADTLVERMKVERAKVGVHGEDRGTLYFQIYWGRALSREALGDSDGALKDYERAVKENSRQTDVWVAMGGLYEKAGETTKAKKAYREALKFVPELKTARDGLKRLGESE